MRDGEKKILKRGKGKFCVIFGCTNTYFHNVSMHLFPRADTRPDIRHKWIAFVRRKRKDFDGPSKYMCVCERHFEESCYPQKYKILKGMGKEEDIRMKTLLPDAIPTIQAWSIPSARRRNKVPPVITEHLPRESVNATDKGIDVGSMDTASPAKTNIGRRTLSKLQYMPRRLVESDADLELNPR